MKGGLFLSYNKNIITLVASMFLVASGYTMVIPFLPLYLVELGVPDHEIALWTGLVFSSCFLVAGIMGPIWGKLADLGGKKKMAVRAAVLLGFSYLFCGLCQNQYHLMAARAFQGFANGFVAASMAIISDSADSDKLGGTLGMAQTSGGGRHPGAPHGRCPVPCLRYEEYLLPFRPFSMDRGSGSYRFRER